MATRKRKTTKKKAEAPTTAQGGNGASETDPVFAEDHVLKLTEPELHKFNALRLKVENLLQSIRVNQLELDKLQREFRDAQYNKEQFIKQLQGEAENRNVEYLDFVRSLAKKYKLHPDHMGVEDDTGVLRDLRPPEPAAETN